MKFWKIIKDAKRGMKRRERRMKNKDNPSVLRSFDKIRVEHNKVNLSVKNKNNKRSAKPKALKYFDKTLGDKKKEKNN